MWDSSITCTSSCAASPRRASRCTRRCVGLAFPLLVTPFLVKGHLHHGGAHAFAAHVVLEPGTLLRAGRRQVRRTDRNAQRRTHRAAAHFSAWLALVEHRITVARDRASVVHGEADEPPPQSLLLLLQQCIASDE